MTIHALKHGLALCGAGRPVDWPEGDRWVSYEDHDAREQATCPACLSALGPALRWTVHLTSASLLAPPDPARPRLVLAAMAKPPPWVIALTRGRPAHAFADGADERELMAAAIAERANPLLSQGGTAWAAYAAALDARWSGLELEQGLAPGTWHWMRHDTTWRPDGYPRSRVPGHEIGGPVRDGAILVCTCREHEGCHLRILAPHLIRAGWSVTLYGVPVR